MVRVWETEGGREEAGERRREAGGRAEGARAPAAGAVEEADGGEDEACLRRAWRDTWASGGGRRRGGRSCAAAAAHDLTGEEEVRGREGGRVDGAAHRAQGAGRGVRTRGGGDARTEEADPHDACRGRSSWRLAVQAQGVRRARSSACIAVRAQQCMRSSACAVPGVHGRFDGVPLAPAAVRAKGRCHSKPGQSNHSTMMNWQGRTEG